LYSGPRSIPLDENVANRMPFLAIINSVQCRRACMLLLSISNFSLSPTQHVSTIRPRRNCCRGRGTNDASGVSSSPRSLLAGRIVRQQTQSPCAPQTPLFSFPFPSSPAISFSSPPFTASRLPFFMSPPLPQEPSAWWYQPLEEPYGLWSGTLPLCSPMW
jgi:hypothetical protein